VIVVLQNLGERPSTVMLVIAGATGTLPGSLYFGTVAAPRTPAFALAVAVVVGAIAAVSLWWLLRVSTRHTRGGSASSDSTVGV